MTKVPGITAITDLLSKTYADTFTRADRFVRAGSPAWVNKCITTFDPDDKSYRITNLARKCMQFLVEIIPFFVLGVKLAVGKVCEKGASGASWLCNLPKSIFKGNTKPKGSENGDPADTESIDGSNGEPKEV